MSLSSCLFFSLVCDFSVVGVVTSVLTVVHFSLLWYRAHFGDALCF